MLRKTLIVVAMVAGFLPVAAPAYSSNAAMKGPPPPEVLHRSHDRNSDSSPFKLLLLGAITFYRTFISPTQGGRCGFYPSCSAFGLQAVHEHGPIQGTLLTADRLTRCNLLKGPGPDYYLLPNGKLFDPVSRNLLSEP